MNGTQVLSWVAALFLITSSCLAQSESDTDARLTLSPNSAWQTYKQIAGPQNQFWRGYISQVVRPTQIRSTGISDELVLSVMTPRPTVVKLEDRRNAIAVCSKMLEDGVSIAYFEFVQEPPLGIFGDEESHIRSYVQWMELSATELGCSRFLISVDGGDGSYSVQNANIYRAIYRLSKSISGSDVLKKHAVEVMIKNDTFVSGDLKWLCAVVAHANRMVCKELIESGAIHPLAIPEGPKVNGEGAEPTPAAAREQDEVEDGNDASVTRPDSTGEGSGNESIPKCAHVEPALRFLEAEGIDPNWRIDDKDWETVRRRASFQAFIDLSQIRGLWAASMERFAQENAEIGLSKASQLGGILISIENPSQSISETSAIGRTLKTINDNGFKGWYAIQYSGRTMSLREGSIQAISRLEDLLTVGK